MSLNKTMLIGNLGADPDLRFTPAGTAVTTLRLATNESFTDREGKKQTRTEWHRVVVWGKQAETCAEYLTKGRQIYVEGRLQTRNWEDKDKVKRYSTEIIAARVQFLGAAPKTTHAAAGTEAVEDESHFTPEEMGESEVPAQRLSAAEAFGG